MGDLDRRCGTCACFTRDFDHPAMGRVGECALQIYPPPVRATDTCTRYRPKGAQAPARPQRVAGEPRRPSTSSGGGWNQASPQAGDVASQVVRRPLPQEIDIDMEIHEFRRVLREILADELGVGDAELGQRWQGGEIILSPGNTDTQEKRVPIEAFFHKIVMVRDKLRVLEQKVNAHPGLSDEEKIQMQSYITGCYGSLTTFNILFARRDDGFNTKK